MSLDFELVWFDSMGAKSSCTYVKTPDVKIVIDPGISIMHDSFPAKPSDKIMWLETGKNKIINVCRDADIIIISHYHYDHFLSDLLDIYKDKIIFAKNPNEFINDSQRSRAKDFFNDIDKYFNLGLSDQCECLPKEKTYPNPLEDFPIAMNKNFKTYSKRREELLKKGKLWFDKRASNWNSYKQINEVKSDNLKILFPDGKSFDFGETKIRFSSPLFHGIEFARVGWIFATIIEYGDEKIMHTSDVCGPVIEDYADYIIRENPTVLILDGPMTYMFGYLINKINLNRTIENAVRIVKEIDAEIIIYDHHLTRENRFRERTKKVWETANKLNKLVLTASEYYKKKPVVENGML